MNLTDFMARQNKPLHLFIGIALLAAVISLDRATPAGFEASLFYLLPVSFFASFVGKRSGLIVSSISAGVAVAIHRTNLPSGSSLVYWNAVAWLAVYVLFVSIISEIRNLYARERSSSRTDPLTGIPNRRGFLERLEIENARARRYGSPLTLAYIDLDHFKEVNDMFGHAAGDQLLGIIGQVLKEDVRRADTIARLGGDEFAVLLPETDCAPASTALEKLRTALNAAIEKHNWPVTFSIGLVTFKSPPESVQDMISAADRAMYEAKQGGRAKRNGQPPQHK